MDIEISSNESILGRFKGHRVNKNGENVEADFIITDEHIYFQKLKIPYESVTKFFVGDDSLFDTSSNGKGKTNEFKWIIENEEFGDIVETMQQFYSVDLSDDKKKLLEKKIIKKIAKQNKAYPKSQSKQNIHETWDDQNELPKSQSKQSIHEAIDDFTTQFEKIQKNSQIRGNNEILVNLKGDILNSDRIVVKLREKFEYEDDEEFFFKRTESVFADSLVNASNFDEFHTKKKSNVLNDNDKNTKKKYGQTQNLFIDVTDEENRTRKVQDIDSEKKLETFIQKRKGSESIDVNDVKKTIANRFKKRTKRTPSLIQRELNNLEKRLIQKDTLHKREIQKITRKYKKELARLEFLNDELEHDLHFKGESLKILDSKYQEMFSDLKDDCSRDKNEEEYKKLRIKERLRFEHLKTVKLLQGHYKTTINESELRNEKILSTLQTEKNKTIENIVNNYERSIQTIEKKQSGHLNDLHSLYKKVLYEQNKHNKGELEKDVEKERKKYEKLISKCSIEFEETFNEMKKEYDNTINVMRSRNQLLMNKTKDNYEMRIDDLKKENEKVVKFIESEHTKTVKIIQDEVCNTMNGLLGKQTSLNDTVNVSSQQVMMKNLELATHKSQIDSLLKEKNHNLKTISSLINFKTTFDEVKMERDDAITEVARIKDIEKDALEMKKHVETSIQPYITRCKYLESKIEQKEHDAEVIGLHLRESLEFRDKIVGEIRWYKGKFGLLRKTIHELSAKLNIQMERTEKSDKVIQQLIKERSELKQQINQTKSDKRNEDKFETRYKMLEVDTQQLKVSFMDVKKKINISEKRREVSEKKISQIKRSLEKRLNDRIDVHVLYNQFFQKDRRSKRRTSKKHNQRRDSVNSSTSSNYNSNRIVNDIGIQCDLLKKETTFRHTPRKKILKFKSPSHFNFNDTPKKTLLMKRNSPEKTSI